MAEQASDRIHITDLWVPCIIGVNAHERTHPQEVRIDLALDVDLSLAGRTDRIEHSVDYKALKDRILAAIEPSQWYLLERLAQAVADVCLAEPRVRRVRVRVDKPGALTRARSVGVEITRARSSDAPTPGEGGA